MLSTLNITGPIYSSYKYANPGFGPDTFSCAERTVEKMVQEPTSAERPGMLLGKVQSGKTAAKILGIIEPTLIMEREEGYDFDWQAAQAALTYLSNQHSNPSERGKVLLLVRKGRNMGRLASAGSHAKYVETPETASSEGRIARQAAQEHPLLMLLRQEGTKEQGWMGTPFYWPIILAQKETPTVIYAEEVDETP